MQRRTHTAQPACEISEESALEEPQMNDTLLLTFLVVFRVANALVCATSFVPDEYWQALEVAHKAVFGYGYLTWEWEKAIRGYTHPLIFAALYKMLSILRLDWPCLLVVLPRVLQALLAAWSDLYVLKLASLMYGRKAGWYALLWNLASWFTFYCSTRTLSNSIEAALIPIGLYYWTLACRANEKSDLQECTRAYLWLAGISFLIRPTSAIFWLPVTVLHLTTCTRSFTNVRVITQDTTLAAFYTLCWSVMVDWYFYGKAFFVQLNFVRFNVFEGNSAVYGTHPWHWYITQGVPVVLFTSLPLVLMGVWLSPGSKRTPFWLSLWFVIVHSFLGHKEFRFIFAIVPVASVYAGYCMLNINIVYRRLAKALVYCLLLANIPMALYFSVIHQRGTVVVMDFLRKDIDSNSSVLFLMPCHSTPFYSHIHRNITMKFLECPPPIDSQYKDVAEDFYTDPEEWLDSHYPEGPLLPTHLVIFNALKPRIQKFISEHRYEEATMLFHSHIPESRTGTHVLVLRR